MKLFNLLPQVNLSLTEAKARIEHPEDMIFDDGLDGAKRAFHILSATAHKPEYVSIKFDGTPALIFGWKDHKFVLTDKAGFSSKKYDGLTTSPEAIVNMLMSRKMKDTSPSAKSARLAYANKIASLYPLLKKVTPKGFIGYVQSDLLWTGVPPIVDGAYEFTPNKITYRVPLNSQYGEMIGNSSAGVVIHSVYQSPSDQEPEALRNVADYGFRSDLGLAILPHEATMLTSLKLDKSLVDKLSHLFRVHAVSVKSFLDRGQLETQKIASLPGYMKSFLAKKAEKGSSNFSHVAREFLDWFTGINSPASPGMQEKCLKWIQSHMHGYNSVWRIVSLLNSLKLDLKSQMDNQAGSTVGASLGGQPGHEGFVAVTPTGIVKFVNRAQFMRKAQPESLMEQSTKSVVWTFGRMNPPTLGHQHLVNLMAKHAGDDDYWIFLSHSQDGKKNPLPWEEKVEFFQRIMPDHAEHLVQDPDVKTPLQAAEWLYNKGYRDFVFVAGEDRVKGMRELLDSWNSPEIREKHQREPIHIKVVSAGERNPDHNGVKGVSGTKAREAVLNKDKEAFQQAVGLDLELSNQLFQAVRRYLKHPRNKVMESSLHPAGTIVTLTMSPPHAAQLKEWCDKNGVPCMNTDELHMTVLYSQKPASHLMSMHGNTVVVPAKIQGWTKLGDKALCLDLDCEIAHKFHHHLKSKGGTHDFPDFIPHSSVNYSWMDRTDLPQVLPDFPLLFDRIQVKPLDPNWGLKT
jgi:hypothetical protein